MDELDIAGRQYISTRRAGREHGYHSDYIGQLIRGGKVKGQKVGRSWYVDAESLAIYLGKGIPESAMPSVVANETPVQTQPAVEEKKVEVEVAEKKEEIQEKVEVASTVVATIPEPTSVVEVAKENIAAKENSTHPAPPVVEERVVPVHAVASIGKEEQPRTPSSGLIYVHDDAPSLPHVRTAATDEYVAAPMAQAAVAFAPHNRFSFVKGAALGSLLGLALILGVSAAAYLSLNLQVADQSATTYYGIQK